MSMPEHDKRDILTLIIQDQANKRCMDCLSQVPNVACLTFGTFICNKCAEIHRELGFKVKPIGTSSFTDDELRQLSMQGNSAARLRWLARWTPADFPEPAADDYARTKQFIMMKYREKRWCSPSTADLFSYMDPESQQTNFPSHPFTASSPDHHLSPTSAIPQLPKQVPPSPKLIDIYSYVPPPPVVSDQRVAQLMDIPVMHMQPAIQPTTPDFMSPSIPPRRTESAPPGYENQIQHNNTPFSEPAPPYDVTSPTNLTRAPPNPFVDEPSPPQQPPQQEQQAPPASTNPFADPSPSPTPSNPFDPSPHPAYRTQPTPFGQSPQINANAAPVPLRHAPALQKTGSLPLFATPHPHQPPGPSPFSTSANTTGGLSPPKPSPMLQSLSTNSTPISSPMLVSALPVSAAVSNQLLNSSSTNNVSSPLVAPVPAPNNPPTTPALNSNPPLMNGSTSNPNIPGVLSPSVNPSPPTNTPIPNGALSQPQDDTNSKLLEEVRTLKQLFEMNMMEKEEYEARRIQLINSLTKTTHTNTPATPAVTEPRLVGTERAIRHRYDVKKAKWCHTATIVIVEQNPFAEGAMRKAYRMRDLSQEGPQSLMVAKIFRDPNEERASYFKDVEMQMQAKEIAERYNRKNPPKKVDFVSAFVYELVDRPNKQICSAEYYIDGKFEKHNNNFGYINDDTDRNTPQAFSHFSYEDSSGQLIVVDIQGVGDMYTDPQIHTADGQGYGRGNLGVEGINKFFSTHACNQICHFLGVAAVNPKQPLADSGTKPQPRQPQQQQQSNNDRFNFGGDVFDVQRQRQPQPQPLPAKK